MQDNAEAQLSQQIAGRKPRRKKRDLEFIKFRARLFSDESLLKFGTNEKGERVCYGVSIDKLCQAIDEGRF